MYRSPPCLALSCFASVALAAAPLAGATDSGELQPNSFSQAAQRSASDSHNCSGRAKGVPLGLAEVVDYALCHHPQTQLAWANARGQAAQLGLAESPFYPSLSASATRSRVDGSQLGHDQTQAVATANYLIYDFGGRDANLENARQLLRSLIATQDATLQAVFLAAVQAYYQYYATAAAVVAARQAELASQESLKLAQARYQVGSATPADRLQAQTAASQASLNRIQAEGAAKIALGVLANAMGLDAQEEIDLQAPPEALTEDAAPGRLDDLIAMAKRLRPDLLAAQAQYKAAQAAVDGAKAAGMPTLSLLANAGYNDYGSNNSSRTSALGLALNIPLFTGYSSRYQLRLAQSQAEAKAAQQEQLSKQVSLDVWRAYFDWLTAAEALRASKDLLASAEQSQRVASGRYAAGAGAVLDLLNAQSALASARQQQVQSQYSWRIAKANLALAVGQLDFVQFALPTK